MRSAVRLSSDSSRDSDLLTNITTLSNIHVYSLIWHSTISKCTNNVY